MEQIENQKEENILAGELQMPGERQHLFATLDALLDFAKVFKITNFNSRSGYNQQGSLVYQITYTTQDN
jgi:hypothetical protein